MKNDMAMPSEISKSKSESLREMAGPTMTSPWKTYQLRLAQTENLFQAQDNQEHSTQKGSVELYWRACLNRIRRQQALVELKIKETECLSKAGMAVGFKLEAAVPPQFRVAITSLHETEAETHKQWVTASENNFRLLAHLEQVEFRYGAEKANFVTSEVAAENAEAAACVLQLESALFEGKCQHWPVYLNDTLQQGWSAIGLLKSQWDANELENKLAEATQDLEKITHYLSEIEALAATSGTTAEFGTDSYSGFNPDPNGVTDLLGLCHAIAAKYGSPELLQRPGRTVS